MSKAEDEEMGLTITVLQVVKLGRAVVAAAQGADGPRSAGSDGERDWAVGIAFADGNEGEPRGDGS